MLMIVDADTEVASELCQISDEGCLAHRSLSLQKHWEATNAHHTHQVLQVSLHSLSDDILLEYLQLLSWDLSTKKIIRREWKSHMDKRTIKGLGCFYDN